MRKPITHASFHESVKSWSYEEFKARYSDQFTPDELEHFAHKLGIKGEKPTPEASTEVEVNDKINQRKPGKTV